MFEIAQLNYCTNGRGADSNVAFRLTHSRPIAIAYDNSDNKKHVLSCAIAAAIYVDYRTS